ncbi:MAG: hypothetical protein ACOC22_04905 [bacterium]
MLISGTIVEKVNVDPKDVIDNLLKEELDYNKWIKKKDNKYYICFNQSAGCHSFEEEVEITQERYEYIEALEIVKKNLEENENIGNR